jgi:DNA-directed RNA polymerase specialized sigma24 family protein
LYSREGGEMLSNYFFGLKRAPFERRSCLPHFAECLLRCHASLYRNARSLCGVPVVEGLLRETYSRASAAKRRPSANADEVRSWMFTILRNVWLNERRRIRRSRESSFRGRRRCRFHRMRSAVFLPFGRIHLHPAPDKT